MICVCMRVSGKDIKMIKSSNAYLHPSTINTATPGAGEAEIRSTSEARRSAEAEIRDQFSA